MVFRLNHYVERSNAGVELLDRAIVPVEGWGQEIQDRSIRQLRGRTGWGRNLGVSG
jgi:hypothetical protein